MLDSSDYVDEAPDLGLRLCSMPASAAAREKSSIRFARVIPDGSGRIGLIDAKGGLRLVHPHHHPSSRQEDQEAAGSYFRVLLNSFTVLGEDSNEGEDEEKEYATTSTAAAGGAAASRPKPVNLPWTDLAFVPGKRGSLFLLLGESNTTMYTSLPEGGDIISGSFVYGSRLVPLQGHKSRIRAIDVDHTGSVLASGDESGILRLWSLSSREEGSKTMAFYPHGSMVAGEPKVVDIRAHTGPVFAVAHGQALTSEEGSIITGGGDRVVRVWSWQMDELGGLTVHPLHTLMTESCEILCLDASSSLGLILAGTNRGSLYCWSSLTGSLEYVAMSGSKPLLHVTALAEEGGLEESVLATADTAGIVRLYRPSTGLEGEGEMTWRPVAECALDGPVVGVFIMEAGETQAESDLVVVSSTGLIMPWPVADLPRTPDEEGLGGLGVDLKEAEEEETTEAATIFSRAESKDPFRATRTALSSSGTAESNSVALAATPPVVSESREQQQLYEVENEGEEEVGEEEEEEKEEEVEEEEEEAVARATAPQPTVFTAPTELPVQMEEDDVMEEPRRTPPPQPSIVPPPSGKEKKETIKKGPVVMSTYRERERIKSALAGERGPDFKIKETAQGSSVGGWLPCSVSAPAVNSTAQLKELLKKTQRERFNEEDVAISDTSSVIEDAARALNVGFKEQMYKGVQSRDYFEPVSAKVIKKQVDSDWLAKQELRPTAEDFFTPNLEVAIRAKFKTMTVIPNKGKGEIDREGLDPFRALYRTIL